jgi:hypothetical protein
VSVRVVETVAELARIEGDLAAGAKLIVDHVHFLQPEEPVRVVRTIELAP